MTPSDWSEQPALMLWLISVSGVTFIQTHKIKIYPWFFPVTFWMEKQKHQNKKNPMNVHDSDNSVMEKQKSERAQGQHGVELNGRCLGRFNVWNMCAHLARTGHFSVRVLAVLWSSFGCSNLTRVISPHSAQVVSRESPHHRWINMSPIKVIPIGEEALSNQGPHVTDIVLRHASCGEMWWFSWHQASVFVLQRWWTALQLLPSPKPEAQRPFSGTDNARVLQWAPAPFLLCWRSWSSACVWLIFPADAAPRWGGLSSYF